MNKKTTLIIGITFLILGTTILLTAALKNTIQDNKKTITQILQKNLGETQQTQEKNPLTNTPTKIQNNIICTPTTRTGSTEKNITVWNQTTQKNNIITEIEYNTYTENICKYTESFNFTTTDKNITIDFGDFGGCNYNDTCVYCDSKYDGNGDGNCDSGESCIIYCINDKNIITYEKDGGTTYLTHDPNFNRPKPSTTTTSPGE